VYAGAIMVLFLYVIMMLNLNTETEPHKTGFLRLSAIICAVLFVVIFIGSLKGADTMIAVPTSDPGAIGVVKNLGKVLFTDFLLPFEIVSILLLAAMVGAVMLGKSEKPEISKKP
jgi:NADH-quinone oxidoreductase subunit J